MTKLIGIMFISLATGAWGFEYASMLKCRLRSLEAILRLIESLTSKISAFLTPTGEFFDSYCDEYLEECGFLKHLREKKSFSDALRLCADALFLNDGDISLLCEFADGLGAISAEQEVKRCNYYKNKCAERLSEAKTELPLRSRLYKSIGFMSALLAAVLVL
ncbi:MAG: stage III sporulation protein AB [Clostridia bacterium]|nr:stage III sporulation protein AB [Clostridia bacterium]